MTLEGILENLVADALVLVGVTVGGIVVLIVTRWRTHTRLLRFLSCQYEMSRLVVFFSTLVVRQWGSLGFDGLPRSYAGPAVPETEYLIARTISRALELPAQGWFSRLLARALQVIPGERTRYWLSSRDIEVEYELSPLQIPVPLPAAVTLCLGSPGYNYATSFYLSNLNPLLTFGPDPHPDIRESTGAAVAHNGDIGMLQRLRTTGGFPVYFAAGLGVNGTRGAVEYLFTEWRSLEERFGTADFALALGFRWFHEDPFGFHRPIELRALSR
jgi:hypothetical protein